MDIFGKQSLAESCKTSFSERKFWLFNILEEFISHL